MFNIFKTKEKKPKKKESLFWALSACLAFVVDLIVYFPTTKADWLILGSLVFIVFGAIYLKKKGIIKKSFKIQ